MFPKQISATGKKPQDRVPGHFSIRNHRLSPSPTTLFTCCGHPAKHPAAVSVGFSFSSCHCLRHTLLPFPPVTVNTTFTFHHHHQFRCPSSQDQKKSKKNSPKSNPFSGVVHLLSPQPEVQMAFNGRGGAGMSAVAAGEHSHKAFSVASFGSSATASPHSHLQHPKPTSSQKLTTFALSPSSSADQAAERNANLDFSQAQSFARKELLGGSFGDLSGVPREPEESPEDMQKKDPLATQVWRLYSKQKNVLPNAERMENLTWRMMSMTLRKEQQQAR